MKVMLSGGEAGGQEVEVSDDATEVGVGTLRYRIEPVDKKNPTAQRVGTFIGEVDSE